MTSQIRPVPRLAVLSNVQVKAGTNGWWKVSLVTDPKYLSERSSEKRHRDGARVSWKLSSWHAWWCTGWKNWFSGRSVPVIVAAEETMCCSSFGMWPYVLLWERSLFSLVKRGKRSAGNARVWTLPMQKWFQRETFICWKKWLLFIKWRAKKTRFRVLS